MYHRTIPLLLLATALSPAGAQTIADNYIEIEVGDTVPVKVRNIVYEVTPQDPQAANTTYDENSDYEKTMREASERVARATDKLTKEIVAAGYKLGEAPVYGDPYSISSYDQGNAQPAIRVVLANEGELKKFVAWLRPHGNVDGHVAEWNYEPQGDAMDALMSTLFAKAHAQAERLATLGGRKVGKLLSAHDPEDREMTFKDFISAMDDHNGNEDAMRQLRMRTRRMVFRFALTD